MAFVDVEAALQIVSVTPGSSSLTLTASGVKQVGPITAAVTDSFNRIRIAGSTPADGVPVALALGQLVELDAQVGVATGTLALGESAQLEVRLDSILEIQNAGSSDATVNFFLEREHRLRSPIDDPAVDFARARKLFSLVGTSLDALGAPSDDFSHGFDMQVQQDQESILPEDKLNFSLLIPAGGSGQVTMSSIARSRVTLGPVPEATSATLGCLGIALLAFLRRRSL